MRTSFGPTATAPVQDALASQPIAVAHIPAGEETALVFLTPEGEAIEANDWPAPPATATALASEATLARVWDTPEEDEGCRSLLAGT